ncbi:hypothetical protein MMC26_000344 [Xylographa opegraphella]|nr:hypothetical protein [Xylographa opegraphella]
MFDDYFSFAPSSSSSSSSSAAAHPSIPSALAPPLSRALPFLDEGYSSSASASASASDSITDLSTRFGRHSLRPPPPHPTATLYPPPTTTTPHRPSIRHQRQLATRRQCSSENLTRISHLVERLLHDSSDAHCLATRSAARIAHQSTYSASAAWSHPSPQSPTSSLDDSESDYGRAAGPSREREHELLGARQWSTADAARSRRRDAVEKTVRMRKRPGGRAVRRKE